MLSENFALATSASEHQIEAEKMEEIIDFILQGKYSSACLLLLESTGQDPLHYIPYRTYNRLQKQRQQAVRSAIEEKTTDTTPLRSRLSDLDYVEALPEKAHSVQGGFSSRSRTFWVETTPLPFWQHRANAG